MNHERCQGLLNEVEKELSNDFSTSSLSELVWCVGNSSRLAVLVLSFTREIHRGKEDGLDGARQQLLWASTALLTHLDIACRLAQEAQF